jgi:hypothetical protein
VLQEAIGETACGGTEVGADRPLKGRSESLKGGLQLLSPSGYVRRGLKDHYLRIVGDACSGLIDNRPLDHHPAGEDEGLGSASGLG